MEGGGGSIPNQIVLDFHSIVFLFVCFLGRVLVFDFSNLNKGDDKR